MIFINKSTTPLKFTFSFYGIGKQYKVLLKMGDKLFLPEAPYTTWKKKGESRAPWTRWEEVDLQNTNLPYTIDLMQFRHLFKSLKAPFIRNVPVADYTAKSLFNELKWVVAQELIGDGIDPPLLTERIPKFRVHGHDPWQEAKKGPSEATKKDQAKLNTCLRKLRGDMEEELEPYA